MKINPVVEYFSEIAENGKDETYGVLRIYNEIREVIAESPRFAASLTKQLIYDNITYIALPNNQILVTWDSLVNKFSKIE